MKTESRQTQQEQLIRSLHQEIERQQRELRPLEHARRELQRELRRLARRQRLEDTAYVLPGGKTYGPESAACDPKVVGDMGADAVELDREIERQHTRINVLIDVLEQLVSHACWEDGAPEDGAPAAPPDHTDRRDTPADPLPAMGLGRLPGRLLQFRADRSKDR